MPGALAWGYDTTNKVWLPVQVDSAGRLKVDMSAINLDDLGDVSVATPTDGYVLTYHAASGLWIAAAPAGGMSVHGNEYHDPDFEGEGVAATLVETHRTTEVHIEPQPPAAHGNEAHDPDFEEEGVAASLVGTHAALTTGVHGAGTNVLLNSSLMTNLFTPIAGEIIRQSVTSKCPSPFSALINGTPNGTSVVYDGETNEASVAGLYSGAGYWGRIMLYNSTRSTYRKIVSVNITTNTITTESSTDTWANNDAITTQSQTNAEAGFIDVDLSAIIPSTATVLYMGSLYQDLDKTAYDIARQLIVHPYSAFDDGKRCFNYAAVIGQGSCIYFFIPVISQKITVQYRGTANTMLIILLAKGYY